MPLRRPGWRLSIWLGAVFILVTRVRVAALDSGGDTQGVFSISSWTIQEGLPGNAVVALAQSSDGYLWLATINGPARFDGARVVPVRLWDGLPSLLAQRLLMDHTGRLWIGTQDAGLTMLEGGRFRSFGQVEGLPGHNVRGLAQDPQGAVWVATDEGLARWDGKFTNMAPPRETPGRAGFTSVCCGAEKTFVVSEDWRVWEWKKSSWSMLPPLGIRARRFDRVFVSRAGVVWAQLNPAGLARLEETPPVSADGEQTGTTNPAAAWKQTWRVLGSESGLPDTYISCALEQTNGDFLFGSFERGLYHFHNDHATPVALNEPPDMDGVLALLADADGNLWAGTRTRGLLRLREPRVRTLAGAGVVRIARLAYEKSGRFWIGGGEGLWFGKEGALSAVPLPERLGKWNVAAMLPAADGGMWLGVFNGGLWRFNPDTQEKPLPQLPAPNLNASVVSLASDRADGIWFGTVGGRIVHLGRDGLKWFSPVETEQKRISVLATDPAGGVWAGTEGAGVLRLDETGKVLLQLSREQGLPGKFARNLLRDREGVIWISTPGGLCRWDGSRLQLYDSRHGLPDEHIASVAEDDAGRLWCSANNTLFRLDKSELEAIAAGRATVAHPMIVGPSDGLRPVPFATGISSEAIRGPNGRLSFPRIWDVLTLAPQDFEKPPPAPRPRIEEVFVDGHPVGLRGMETTPVRVPPRRSQVEIRYTAFQWTAPETLRFRYRLVDVDEQWTEAGDQRVATFRRLPPGSYRFETTAAVGGAEWAEPASLAFVIEPLFWQTAWFRALAMVVAASAIGGLVWTRIRTLEKRHGAQELFSRRLLESQEQERKRIAAELHDSLGQNLLVIKNRAAMGKNPGGSPAEELDAIGSLAAQSIEEVREISQNLRPYQLDRLGLTRALHGLVKKVGTSGAVNCTADITPVDRLFPSEEEVHFFRIVQEALNNVLKHSRASEARVMIERDEIRVRLLVQDNGRGFDWPLKPGQAQGMGLSGIAERARILHGHVAIESAPGQGTRVMIEVPIPGTA